MPPCITCHDIGQDRCPPSPKGCGGVDYAPLETMWSCTNCGGRGMVPCPTCTPALAVKVAA